MKKVFFTLLLLSPLEIFAQSIGIKGGLINSMYTKSFWEWSNKKRVNGLVLGLVYKHDFNRFRLSIEPAVAPKGFSATNEGEITWRYKYYYIEMPITLGYQILDKRVYWGLNAGLAPAYSVYTSAESSEPSGYNTWSYGIFVLDAVVGTELGYKFSDKIFAALNLRYGHSTITDGTDLEYNYFSPFINIGYKLK